MIHTRIYIYICVYIHTYITITLLEIYLQEEIMLDLQ